MKIAIIHSFYSEALPSGENTVVRLQAAALERAGHEVRLISVSTDALRGQKFYTARSAINVVTGRGVDPTPELESFDPDITHVHNLFPNFSTRWLRDWNGVIVSTLHNFRPVCASGILYRDNKMCTLCPQGSQVNAVVHGCYRGSSLASIPLAIRNTRGPNLDPVLARSDGLIMLSERSRKQWSDFGLVNRNTEVIPNFVNAMMNSPKRRDASSWIYVGRIAPEKGTLQLLEHWPKSESIDVYGDGPDAEAVARLGRPNIRFHGSAPNLVVRSKMTESIGLIIPSTCAENFPTVYAEALASGVPVVAKSGNAAADDVSLARVGSVFEHWTDVEASLLAVRRERERLSRRAQERYSNNFTEERWLDRILGHYSAAIAHNRAAS